MYSHYPEEAVWNFSFKDMRRVFTAKLIYFFFTYFRIRNLLVLTLLTDREELLVLFGVMLALSTLSAQN